MSFQHTVRPPFSAAARGPPGQNMQQMGGRRVVASDPRLHQIVGKNQFNKKRRRMADRLLTKTVRQIIPESESYMELLEVEKKLDLVLMRKRLTLQESLKQPLKTKRILRVMLSSTFKPGNIDSIGPDGQPVNDGCPPGWELKVEGQLLEKPPGQPNGPPTVDTRFRRKFSTFFKSLVIELDHELYGPDNHLVEWHRTSSTTETDGFQVKRSGDSNVRCTILLMLDYQPPQYKLDPRLARILGLHTGTRSQIFYALWNYIKVHRLQDSHEKDFINCDAYLEQVFGCPRMRFAEIPSRLIQLQQAPDPIVINHVIVNDPEDPNKTLCYDIEVEVDDVYKSMVQNYLQNTQSNQELMAIDNKIHELVEQINQMKVHREFYLEFSQDPHTFITRWLASQSHDLQQMTDATPGHPEQERHADFYDASWVYEAVKRYLYNRVVQRRQELEHALNLSGQ
ncbi:SWI/SNF-related matrix-associated actin-dependent regulator of chromatin subfamily D member 1 [Echinococcus granulosus]|nr:SWI/SNF-related matrix-associated actin-dependent regulator of chromatin subfamily D member 1 [Echinococcus granulosus]